MLRTHGGDLRKLEVSVTRWQRNTVDNDKMGGWVTKQWLMDNRSYSQSLDKLQWLKEAYMLYTPYTPPCAQHILILSHSFDSSNTQGVWPTMPLPGPRAAQGCGGLTHVTKRRRHDWLSVRPSSSKTSVVMRCSLEHLSKPMLLGYATVTIHFHNVSCI